MNMSFYKRWKVGYSSVSKVIAHTSGSAVVCVCEMPCDITPAPAEAVERLGSAVDGVERGSSPLDMVVGVQEYPAGRDDITERAGMCKAVRVTNSAHVT